MASKASRYDELEKILKERRAEIAVSVEEKMGDLRAGMSARDGVVDATEDSVAENLTDIEFALVQMRTKMLAKIDLALCRLKDGTFGNCFECDEEISERRLRAMPFALRCKDCEEARELAENREQRRRARVIGPGIFTD